MPELIMVCGPVLPPPDAVVTKLCAHLGYRIAGDASPRADFALYWDPETWRQPPAALAQLATDIPILNVHCRDFSKQRVNDAHQLIFGRSLRIDPHTHAGAFVVKSDRNATHDGRVVNEPIARPSDEFVYQRVVDNRMDEAMVVDLRTPVMGTRIPLVYKLYRPLAHRFSVDDTRAEIFNTTEVFSADEAELLVRFAVEMGMDYGELDVLRDRNDGRTWVVDANPTPWGPPRTLGPAEQQKAVERLSRDFQTLVEERIAAGSSGTAAS